MKRVLITGKGSYIGTKVQEWLMKYPDKYQVDVLDMIGDDWKKYDFRGYDAVYHVAGIAHRKNVSIKQYKQVNHILAVNVAKKASDAGVKQFIFMSSGAVYSQSDRKHKTIIVDDNTPLTPSTPYGISKMKAELELNELKTEMNIAIIRPPMVYGPGAKGNYNSLSKLAKKTPIFPKINNKRSMIYIDNLCEFVRLIIDNVDSGIFIPQNREYVNTSILVKEIRHCNGMETYLIKGFNSAILIAGKLFNSVNKAFGTFYYKNCEYYQGKYQIIGFEESIKETEEYCMENIKNE